MANIKDMNKQVLCFGEVLWDALPEGKKPGGAPMNVAMHLRQQGIDATMASRIGDDGPGIELAEFLKNQNLYSDLIQVDPVLPTCEVSVQLDAEQQATYSIPYPVSWDNIQCEKKLIEAAAEIPVIVFGSLVCRNPTSKETLLEILKKSALKIFDVNMRAPHYNMDTLKQLAAMADVIKMNHQELDMLTGTELMHLSQKEKMLFLAEYFGCKTICITRGDAGAIIFLNDGFYEHPGFKVELKDTVGAGDAFLATFIRGILRSEKPETIVKNACAMGAFVAGNAGANPVHDLEKIREISEQTF